MIDRKALLDDLKKLVTKLEKDLRERCEENAEVDTRVRMEYEKAKEAKRTAQAYKVWRDEWITQVAVAWVLGVVFVRFIEDNGLIAAPFIAGPGKRLQFAKEQRTAFFQQNPTQSDREYLEHLFREVAKLPAMKELFDERHNPLWALGVSGDGAKLILEQFQKIEPQTGTLVHDFTDPEWNTRFLGDLYQDLSEAARKKYALLQTPDFVEEFILNRTLDPAIAEFGLEAVRMIDPTCGSGHFLLGGFARLFRLWDEREPSANATVLAQRALDAVYGVDLNPFATAISRIRLLLAAMKASRVKRLVDSPDFRMNLATGDSLLHGPRFSATAGVQANLDPADDPLRHVYATEDREELRRILGQQYHSVVGNPPYITVKDKALNVAYRQKYGSCHRQYSLAVPFMERFFELALAKTEDRAAGFVGQITANSFMKREFGSKLIESFIPTWDLTHMIDTSGAYVPGHGTPTVILFGRNQLPVAETVRAVMGIRGEPSTPDEPSLGRVWKAITSQVNAPGTASEWVSVSDAPRSSFHKHPWSIGGGGAAELKARIEAGCDRRVDELVHVIGYMAVTREDDAYDVSREVARRHRVPLSNIRDLIAGEDVRDWVFGPVDGSLWPYDPQTLKPLADGQTARFLWPLKTQLRERVAYGSTQVDRGLQWFEYSMFFKERFSGRSISFAEVATHNHFVLDLGGKVFKQTAPVIKLPPNATENEHLGLLGLLNSSTACFWLKQVAHNKGAGGGTRVASGHSPLGDESWESHFAFNGGTVANLPVPPRLPGLGRRAQALSERLTEASPEAISVRGTATHDAWRRRREDAEAIQGELVAVQEELDWETYAAFGFAVDGTHSPVTLPPLVPGQRAFEIVLARAIARGEKESKWFEKHGSAQITEIPEEWPAEYRKVVERRIHAIETNPDIRLIEQPEYKRRWKGVPWESHADRALRGWLLTRLEQAPRTGVESITKLAATASSDSEFMQVAALYRGANDFDVGPLVTELVRSEAVPGLPVDRYKESGLRNRALWEETWALQRREDAGEKIGDIPVPPQYKSSDFRSGVYWSLRGKLDVPKERFISFPGCERESDPSLPILWAGYDHLQQAKAVAAYYQDLKDNEAAPRSKLGKLVACIFELLPWLKQWHNEIDPEYGTRMGDFFESFMHTEMAGLGLTMDDLRRIRGL